MISVSAFARDSVNFGGKKLQCKDRSGRPVPLYYGDDGSPGTAFVNERDGSVIEFNPDILAEYSYEVQWFIFYHECGHIHIGGSELAADKYALGVAHREGWLTERVASRICDSFHNAPETSSHPSGRRRCRHIFERFNELKNIKSPAPLKKPAPTPPRKPRQYWD